MAYEAFLFSLFAPPRTQKIRPLISPHRERIQRPLRTKPRSRTHIATVKMVMAESTMLPLGTVAPDFSLVEPLTGNTVSLDETILEHGVLVVFMCNHCPFVVLLQDQLRELGADLKTMGIGMVGISANDISTHPQDGPETMARYAATKFSTFTYLYDETQHVAKAYRAACTPDVFLFNKDKKLVYRGQVDYARPGNGKEVNGESIRAAVNMLVEGKEIAEDSMIPSIGCNIKWITGNGPDYS